MQSCAKQKNVLILHILSKKNTHINGCKIVHLCTICTVTVGCSTSFIVLLVFFPLLSLVLFVLDKLDRTSSSLFPLVPIFIKSVKFSFATKSKIPRFNQIAMKKKGKPQEQRECEREERETYRSRMEVSSSSPVVTAISSSLTIRAT